MQKLALTWLDPVAFDTARGGSAADRKVADEAPVVDATPPSGSAPASASLERLAARSRMDGSDRPISAECLVRGTPVRRFYGFPAASAQWCCHACRAHLGQGHCIDADFCARGAGHGHASALQCLRTSLRGERLALLGGRSLSPQALDAVAARCRILGRLARGRCFRLSTLSLRPPRSRAITLWHSLHQQAGWLCLVGHDLRVRKPVGGRRRTATLRVLVKFTFEGSSRRDFRRSRIQAANSGFESCRSGDRQIPIALRLMHASSHCFEVAAQSHKHLVVLGPQFLQSAMVSGSHCNPLNDQAPTRLSRSDQKTKLLMIQVRGRRRSGHRQWQRERLPGVRRAGPARQSPRTPGPLQLRLPEVPPAAVQPIQGRTRRRQVRAR